MILKEMAYPSSWSIVEFTSLKNKNLRLEYAKKHLTPIGRGSSRNVYKIDDDKVLKIANISGLDNKGIAQNKQEVDLSKDPYFEDLFSKVFDYDKRKYIWIEMAYAKPITKDIFKNIVGYDFDLFMSVLKNKYRMENVTDFNQEIKTEDTKIFKNPLFKDLLNFLTLYGVGKFTDYYRLDHYGLLNGKIVLIDYGIDSDIFKKYYK